MEEEDRLVNCPSSFVGVLRPLNLGFEQKALSLHVLRDRWDKDLFKLQGG